MHLKILLPFQVFAEVSGVSRLVVEDQQGSFGLWPQRLDCVASLSAGILTYQTEAGEVYVAMDQGILVKTGPDVLVSLRNAQSGKDLGKLRHDVERDHRNLDQEEQELRSFLAKMESGFIHRLAEFQHG